MLIKGNFIKKHGKYTTFIKLVLKIYSEEQKKLLGPLLGLDVYEKRLFRKTLS